MKHFVLLLIFFSYTNLFGQVPDCKDFSIYRRFYKGGTHSAISGAFSYCNSKDTSSVDYSALLDRTNVNNHLISAQELIKILERAENKKWTLYGKTAGIRYAGTLTQEDGIHNLLFLSPQMIVDFSQKRAYQIWREEDSLTLKNLFQSIDSIPVDNQN